MNPFNSNDPIKFVPPQTPKTPTKAPLKCSNICLRVVTMIMVMAMMKILTRIGHFFPALVFKRGKISHRTLCCLGFYCPFEGADRDPLQRLNCSVVGLNPADSLNPHLPSATLQ